jgi:hypothetical protein
MIAFHDLRRRGRALAFWQTFFRDFIANEIYQPPSLFVVGRLGKNFAKELEVLVVDVLFPGHGQLPE